MSSSSSSSCGNISSLFLFMMMTILMMMIGIAYKTKAASWLLLETAVVSREGGKIREISKRVGSCCALVGRGKTKQHHIG